MFLISDLVHIEEEQRCDPPFRAIITELSRGTQSTTFRLYRLRDRILCRCNFHLAGSVSLIVVLEHPRHSILRNPHDGPVAGHMGALRTYSRLKE